MNVKVATTPNQMAADINSSRAATNNVGSINNSSAATNNVTNHNVMSVRAAATPNQTAADQNQTDSSATAANLRTAAEPPNIALCVICHDALGDDPYSG
jgi:hypothetical protein